MDGKLQVRNLSPRTTDDDLRRLFAQIGDVLDVKIIRDDISGKSRGYGFVTMSALSEADTAVSRLDERVLHGLKLIVSLARARVVRGSAAA